MKIDETNIELIKHLRNGRKSFKKIAQDLDLSENTVRTRVTKLIEEGVLEISGVVDAEALPGHTVVIIGVNLQSMDLVKKGAEISELKGVVSVNVVTGRYDLLVMVLLNSHYGLLQFYNETMNKIEGIRSVEAFIVYKAYNLKVPYIL
jgi:Lrp/AsnC family transcriptional regulator for asnA, asnC and gidA